MGSLPPRAYVSSSSLLTSSHVTSGPIQGWLTASCCCWHTHKPPTCPYTQSGRRLKIDSAWAIWVRGEHCVIYSRCVLISSGHWILEMLCVLSQIWLCNAPTVEDQTVKKGLATLHSQGQDERKEYQRSHQTGRPPHPFKWMPIPFQIVTQCEQEGESLSVFYLTCSPAKLNREMSKYL